MATLNEAQSAAVNADGGPLLVSAAAGSGKTRVLVQRAVRLITREKNPVPADRLLMITFTNAAADELRARFFSALDDLRANDPGNETLARQAVSARRATIGTVHAFCRELIKEYCAELDVPPDFQVADDTAMSALRDDALAETLEELYSGNEFSAFADLFGSARSDDSAAAQITALHDFLETVADPDAWRERCLSLLQSEYCDSPCRAELEKEARSLLLSARGIFLSASDMCESDDILTEKFLPKITEAAEQAARALELLDAGRADDCLKLVENFKMQSLTLGKNDKPESAKLIQSLCTDARKILKDSVTPCLSVDPVGFSDECRALRRPVEAFLAAQKLFEEKLRRLKAEKKLLDYSDLERYALRLLRSGAVPVGERYSCVMVDEYQDTNGVQSAIFDALTSDGLFMVGDVKQSIYGFRNADPYIFLSRAESYRPLSEGVFPAMLRLNANYRSTAEIADAVNAVFDLLMTRESSGIDYASGERLVCGSGAHTCGGSGMDIMLIQGGGADEAGYIASSIARMVADGFTVNGEEGPRPCRYGDFAVLCRSHAPVKELCAALEQRSVPFFTDSKEEFFTGDEITELMSALECINNPRRDVPLCALMLSDRFGFTADDMLRLRGKDRSSGVYSLLLLDREDPKTGALLGFLSELRELSLRLPLEELVMRVIDELGLENAALSRPSGERRRDDLRAFVSFAADYRSASSGTLSGFLRYAQRARDADKSIGAGLALAGDAVTLCTIHHSKGLEWPVVFLANAGGGFSTQDSRKSMRFDRELGVGARIALSDENGYRKRVTTCAYRAISLSSQRKSRAEELRLLYVALTRARDKIVVTAAEDNLPSLFDHTRALSSRASEVAPQQNSFLKLLLLAAAGQPDAPITIDWPQADDLLTDRGEQPEPRTDPALADELRRRMDWRYPAGALCEIPAKLSVSQLTKAENGETVRAPSFVNAGKLSAAEKGTAIHEFMQFADYSAASESVEEELLRLISQRYIPDTRADSIDLDALRTLFSSALMRRIVSAEKVLREYEFFLELDAGQIAELPERYASEKVLVQGIADCVVIEPDGAVIVDYKSDRVNSGEQLAERYSAQLALYRKAIEKRLGLPVKSCMLWSFALGRTVEL